MTDPENTDSRPISVAELLARNGTIGAPPAGGQRRRRRGNPDAVTVAELTGEIPVYQTGEIPVVDRDDTAPVPNGAATATEAPPRPEPAPRAEPRTAEPRTADRHDDRHDDYVEHAEHAEPRGSSDAETMSPDPFYADDFADEDDDLALDDDSVDHHRDRRRHDDRDVDQHGDGDSDDPDDRPPYLHGDDHRLFGGHGAVADDDLDDDRTDGRSARTALALRAGMVVLQSIVAVAFGAGLFLAFDQLWNWNSIIALVLAALVIIGLVVAVRLVRKTEDIASMLIALVVGMLVTLGPLPLMLMN
ncbi:hypothetical protein LV457_08395 [Mycobacterium sp. MYCO198283]|uniref:hypothetical protein n=1 Tax=Mycobacterium sp. MYCO198283 TaxID=2883505 RepID=UPI001E3341EE|nr:hypothetical protein [Mycobacterium sp. MYCO198283]MCG5432312.1 hypothetical protein [Mycobacterium sp. MYCO198283]